MSTGTSELAVYKLISGRWEKKESEKFAPEQLEEAIAHIERLREKFPQSRYRLASIHITVLKEWGNDVHPHGTKPA